MAFKDYARSIPRAYPEKLSEKPKPKKKFYTYMRDYSTIGVGRWEIIIDIPDCPGLVECISHDPFYRENSYNLESRYLVELSE